MMLGAELLARWSFPMAREYEHSPRQCQRQEQYEPRWNSNSELVKRNRLSSLPVPSM